MGRLADPAPRGSIHLELFRIVAYPTTSRVVRACPERPIAPARWLRCQRRGGSMFEASGSSIQAPGAPRFPPCSDRMRKVASTGTSCVAGAPRSTLRAVERSRLSPFGLVLLALVTVAWGLSWPAIKIVLAEVPPLTFRAICLVVGGAGVLALARLAGQSLHVPARAWGRLLVVAACNVVGWNTFKIYGIAHLPSGRAALIGYTMPMWSTLFSVWLLGERLTVRRCASLVLGMAGVVVLLAADAAG